MLEKFKKLPLRKGVGVILLNSENKVFVAKRIDNKKNFWQMPQGGVDKGEDLYKAAMRELYEETSIKNIKIIELLLRLQRKEHAHPYCTCSHRYFHNVLCIGRMRKAFHMHLAS